MQMQSLNKSEVTVKIDSQNKIKRVRELPASFEALKQAVEAQLKDNVEVSV